MFERTQVILGDLLGAFRVVATAVVILGVPFMFELFVVYPLVGLGAASGVIMGITYALMLVLTYFAVAYGITYFKSVESRAFEMRRRRFL